MSDPLTLTKRPQASRELDAEVAERVLGQGQSHQTSEVPRYSSEIAAAWELLDRFPDFEVFRIDGEVFVNLWTASDVERDEPNARVKLHGDVPQAICLAAIEAVSRGTAKSSTF